MLDQLQIHLIEIWSRFDILQICAIVFDKIIQLWVGGEIEYHVLPIDLDLQGWSADMILGMPDKLKNKKERKEGKHIVNA